jgi:hypothetical protein
VGEARALGERGAHLLDRHAVRLERALELARRGLLGLEEVHLHARVEVHAPSPLVSTGQKMLPG